MKIVLVGNAPEEHDLSAEIDACDVVIRMNRVPNFGKKTTGTKTDILVPCNTGNVGKELLSEKVMLENPVFAACSEIRIALHQDLLNLRIKEAPRNRFGCTNHASLLDKLPIYKDKKISHISGEIGIGVYKKLYDMSPDPPLPQGKTHRGFVERFIMPSTGIVVIEDLVQNYSDEHEIFFCGFSHEGWNGHPWAAEKKLMEQYMAEGRLKKLESPKKAVPKPLGMEPYPAGIAVFLNSTTTSYHWGCFGTSVAIRERIERAGYLVNRFPVDVTHYALPEHKIGAPLDARQYGRALKDRNLALFLAIEEADIIVVNGEGTLHRNHAGPINLLALLWYAKSLGKPVHLINHGCFPNGDGAPAAKSVEDYYRYCLAKVDTIAPRDPVSRSVYDRLGLKSVQAFDSLPLYIHDYLKPNTRTGDNIVFSGASNWSDHDARVVAKAVAGAAGSRPISFLGGGYKRSPPEDAPHYAAAARAVPKIDFLKPETIGQWVDAISTARLLVTGRFHHFICALSVGTPVVLMPGNTDKCRAVATWMDQKIVSHRDPNLGQHVADALAAPYERKSRLDELVKLANANFEFL